MDTVRSKAMQGGKKKRRATVCVYIGLLVAVFILLIGTWPRTAHAQGVCTISPLTDSGIRGSDPSINAAGTRIAFRSTMNPAGPTVNPNIFLFDTTTNALTQITDTRDPVFRNTNQEPSINAAGTRIAFSSGDDLCASGTTPCTGSNRNPDENFEIFLFDTTTSALAQITDTNGAPVFSNINVDPSINAAGTRIAFRSTSNLCASGTTPCTGSNRNPDGNEEIFLFDTTTSAFTQITDTTVAGALREPLINSDGTRIVFISNNNLCASGTTPCTGSNRNPDGSSEIFLFDTTTSAFTQITAFPSLPGESILIIAELSINAAATRMAFISDNNLCALGTTPCTGSNRNPDGNSEIFLFDTTTNRLTQITNTTGGFFFSNRQPSISSDGTRIAFSSTRDLCASGTTLCTGSNRNPDESSEIFLFDTITSAFTQITTTMAAQPSINSDGTRIALLTRRTPGSSAEIFLATCTLPMPIVKVPIRWCGVQGSPSLPRPQVVNDVLNQRLTRVNDNISNRQARIMFTPGATLAMPNYPLIPDPVVRAGETRGQVSSQLEFNDIINDCRNTWRRSDPSVTGITAIHIDRFVGGLAGTAGLGGWVGDFCSNLGDQQLFGRVMVQDNSYDTGIDPVDKLLGHELGHALCLHHGDGINQDAATGDTKIDEDPPGDIDRIPGLPQCPGICGFDDDGDGSIDEGNVNDDDEDGRVDEDGPGTTDPTNLMGYGWPSGPAPDRVRLTALQVERVRNQALRHIPDRMVDPVLPPLGNTHVDTLREVPAAEAFIDINAVGVAVDPQAEITVFSVSTFGVFPENISNLSYVFCADLDNDPATGGAPADSEVSCALTGVELVGQVHVDVRDGVPQATPTVKTFQAGQFVPVVDSSIQATVVTDVIVLDPRPGESAPPVPAIPVGEMIQLRLSNAVRGPMSMLSRLETMAENPNTGTVDEAEAEITFEVPVFPSCQVTPPKATPGTPVTVEAIDLPPDLTARVFLGLDVVASGSIEDGGNVTIPFEIPTDATTGTPSVTVRAGDTAITAACTVIIAEIVNDRVAFEPIRSTFSTTAETAGCPSGFVGKFMFDARLTNTSSSSITDLFVKVTELTHGNLLQNADGEPGGVGAVLTVPQVGSFSDGVLGPDEFVDVPFIICLTAIEPFSLIVDVLGIVEEVAE